MARKWTGKLATAGLLLGGACISIIYIGSAQGSNDTNERVKQIVEALSTSGKPRPLELASVEVTKIEATSMTERLRVSGELQPVRRAVLRAKIGGKILEVIPREGQSIKAGDVLVRFETEDLQSTLRQRESDLEATYAELLLNIQTQNRLEQLAANKVSTQEQLDKAKSDVATAKARSQGLISQADIARTALRDAEVTAPFDGAIASRAVDSGSSVSADAELLTMVDISALEARVLVSTRDVTRLQIGQAAELQIDGHDGQAIDGSIDRINPAANEGSRFVTIHIRIENAGRRLWGGMFATGSILVRERKDIFVLPVSALREDGEGEFVLKLDGGKLVRQSVEVGERWNGGDAVEISVGVKAGDTIVTAPLPALVPETPAVISEAG
jgi:RND family efflux transporter MFP subunit